MEAQIYKAGIVKGMLYKKIKWKIMCIDVTSDSPFWCNSCYTNKEFKEHIANGHLTPLC